VIGHHRNTVIRHTGQRKAGSIAGARCRASLDWSHELLTDQERQLFARLSIFSGASTWKSPPLDQLG
jgi:predicted ATPase